MHILWISLGTTKTSPFNWYARWTFADGIRFLKSCVFNTPLYEQVRIFESFTCLICFCFGVSFIVLTEPFIHYDWVSYLIGFREFVVLVLVYQKWCVIVCVIFMFLFWTEIDICGCLILAEKLSKFRNKFADYRYQSFD